MLKKNSLLILLLIIIFVLMGCNTYSQTVEGGTEPQNKIQECFDTYEELETYFAKDENGIAPAMEEMNLHGEMWKESVSNVLAGEYGLFYKVI